jgi:Glycosyl transferase family 2
MSQPQPLEISVTISTFRRPAGLRRLLEGLKQLDPSSPCFEVVVVDNDARETARPIVDDEHAASFELRYFVEPMQSIARARSRGVREPDAAQPCASVQRRPTDAYRQRGQPRLNRGARLHPWDVPQWDAVGSWCDQRS